MNIKNILVPTDFSECAETALSFAAEIARTLQADIYLMNAAQSIFSVASEKLIEQVQNEEALKEVDVQTIEETGDPSSAILRETDEKKVDLIVMGSKGGSGTRKLFGSTTSEVISKSEVPVLVIPRDTHFTGFGTIVFATDYHDGDLSALEEMADWAQLFDSELHVLHVAPKHNLQAKIKFRGFKELASQRIDYEKLSFEHIINKSLHVGFAQYANDHNVKLLAITRYKKSFFEKLSEKNHTREMELYTKVPLLVSVGKETKT
jgi:nucleotide-binding universal stress UspA family protein